MQRQEELAILCDGCFEQEKQKQAQTTELDSQTDTLELAILGIREFITGAALDLAIMDPVRIACSRHLAMDGPASPGPAVTLQRMKQQAPRHGLFMRQKLTAAASGHSITCNG